MSDLIIGNEGRAKIKPFLRRLSNSEKEEFRSFLWFEPRYIRARISDIVGEITARWKDWYFIAHKNGTGIYKEDEFEKLS